jgi:hypothetical protein
VCVCVAVSSQPQLMGEAGDGVATGQVDKPKKKRKRKKKDPAALGDLGSSTGPSSASEWSTVFC